MSEYNLFKTKAGQWAFIIALCAVMISTSVWVSQSAVTNVSGLAVKQKNAATGNVAIWNDVVDGAVGELGLTKGLAGVVLYAGDGTSSRYVKDNGNGSLRVDNTMHGQTMEIFSVVKADLGTSAVAYDFAMDLTGSAASKQIHLRTPSGNSGNVCINFQQSATVLANAACPAANTASTTVVVLAPGDDIMLRDFGATGVSVIASTGTQAVYIKAWNQ